MQHLLNSLPPVLTNFVPPDVVTAGVPCNSSRRRLQWKVRDRERHISEERPVRVLLLVLFHEFNRTVGDRDSRIVTLRDLNGRERLIIERVILGREVMIIVEQRV